MRQTEHLKLQMPEDSDFILIEDLNSNAEILDKTLKNIANTLALLDTQGVDLTELLKKKADLDPSGKVKEDQLPEMKITNFVQIYEAVGNFPTVGERNVLYLSKATNKVYFYDTTDRQYEVISASLDLGETHKTAYRGDRGKIAYDHSQSAHLELGETEDTAYRGDRGKIAYDHSQSAHLGLGVSSSTAYRGDRGKIAYDHSQSPHAPEDALSREESYSREQVDEKVKKSETTLITQINATQEIKKTYGSGYRAYKCGRVVTLYFNGVPSESTLPYGFRPMSEISVALVSGNANSSGYIPKDILTVSTDGRVRFSSYWDNPKSINCVITYITEQ